MPAAKSTDAVKQITYLAAALKAPRITEAAARLADQARDAGIESVVRGGSLGQQGRAGGGQKQGSRIQQTTAAGAGKRRE